MSLERALGARIKIIGGVARARSRYEAPGVPDFEPAIKPGTNLIHPIRDGDEWRIGSMAHRDDIQAVGRS